MSATAEVPAAHVVVGGSGSPILCLHGWGASSELFEPFRKAVESEHSLVIPDLPGFGATPEPEQPWSVDDYVAWTVALMQRTTAGPVDIVAHSFGARIALKLAVAHPQLVKHLVLTGAAGIRGRHGLAYHVRVRTFKLARRAAAWGWLPSALRHAAERRVAAAGSRDYKAVSGAMRGTFVRVVNEDLRSLLPLVSVPTLLVWGDADEETPLSDGQLMEARIPDAGLVVFAGRSHYAYIEEAARFATITTTFLGDGTSA